MKTSELNKDKNNNEHGNIAHNTHLFCSRSSRLWWQMTMFHSNTVSWQSEMHSHNVKCRKVVKLNWTVILWYFSQTIWWLSNESGPPPVFVVILHRFFSGIALEPLNRSISPSWRSCYLMQECCNNSHWLDYFNDSRCYLSYAQCEFVVAVNKSNIGSDAMLKRKQRRIICNRTKERTKNAQNKMKRCTLLQPHSGALL